MFNLKKKDLKELDLILLFATIALSIFGLVVLYSAYGGEIKPIMTQLFATILGFVVILILCTMDLDVIKKSYKFVYGLMLVLLLMTLFLGSFSQAASQYILALVFPNPFW